MQLEKTTPTTKERGRERQGNRGSFPNPNPNIYILILYFITNFLMESIGKYEFKWGKDWGMNPEKIKNWIQSWNSNIG